MPTNQKKQRSTKKTPAKRPPGRPKRESSLDARRKLLDAAADLSRTKPINQISLREVALKAGLSPALSRYYFDDVTELQTELLRNAWQKLDIGGSFKYEPDKPIDELLSDNLHNHSRVIVESPELASLLIQNILFGKTETVGVFIDEFLEPTRAAVEPLFAEGAESGIFNEVNGMDFTLAVLGAAAFYSIAADQLAPAFKKKRMTKKDRAKYVDDITEMAMHFLRKDG